MYDLHFYHHFFMLLQLALTPAVQPTATWDVMVGNSSSCSVPALSSSSSEQITSGDGLLGWGLVLVHGGKKAAERCLVCSVLHPGALLGFGSRLSACCKLEIVPLPPPSPPLFFFSFPVVQLRVGKDLWLCYMNFAEAFLISPYSYLPVLRQGSALHLFGGDFQ